MTIDEHIKLAGNKIKEHYKDSGELNHFKRIFNDELNDKTEKWNPAQELLISYIKECDLNVFEVEKIQDFIRKEIKAKRYKEENT